MIKILTTMDALKQILTEILTPIIKDAVKEAFEDTKVNPPKRYYTLEEAWTALKISRATFYRHINAGRIKVLKIGNKSLIDVDALEAAVERREIYRYKHY